MDASTESDGIANAEKKNVNTKVIRDLAPEMSIMFEIIAAVSSRNDLKPKKKV